jgi:hypothetical protein
MFLLISVVSCFTLGLYAECPPADINGDCLVNMQDLHMLAEQWLQNCAGPDCHDLNNDAVINQKDLALLATVWKASVSPIVITEFLCVGSELTDEDGNTVDWIELYNQSSIPVDLGGWSLTDNESNLTKWRFPSTIIQPGNYRVIFASGKDRRDSASELHTNFTLSADGEYLALILPDGTTIASEYLPVYPQQFGGISYGLGASGATVTGHTLIAEGADASAWVPADDSLGQTWAQVGFNDAGWVAGTTGVGYENNPSDSVNYVSLIDTDVQAMYNNNASVGLHQDTF